MRRKRLSNWLFTFSKTFRRQKLEKELVRIKEETELQLNAMEGKVPKNASTNQEVDWKKKYSVLEKTLQEERVKTTTLKNDLNKALRIISREIGENFDIDQVYLMEAEFNILGIIRRE